MSMNDGQDNTLPAIFYMYENFDRVHRPNEEGLRHEVEKIVSRFNETHGKSNADSVTQQIMGVIKKTQICRKSKKGSRIIACAYKWSVLEGALVRISVQFARFVDRTGQEQFKKTKLGETAMHRLSLKPIMIDVDTSEVEMVSHRNIRRLIRKIVSNTKCYSHQSIPSKCNMWITKNRHWVSFVNHQSITMV